MINPLHRLDQADLLLAQRGRRQADLRAAITAAYYALFHFLIQEACAFHVGRTREGRLLRATLARAFGHEEMKRASAGFASGNIPPILEAVLRGGALPEGDKARTPLHPRLQSTARLFIKMQALRHSADYDPLARFGFAEVRSHVDAVRATLEAWSLLRGRQDTNLYLAALLSMDKLSKR
jgi:hypothetical protein